MPEPKARRPFRLAAGAQRVANDVDAELEFHLAMRTRQLIAAGLDPAAARAQAEQLFGNLPAVRAECLTIDQAWERAVTRANQLDNLRQDATHALRGLRHNPGFTAVLLLILALGIGANTAMFTLIDVLMRRSLPVPHPGQLVGVGDQRRTGSLSTGSPRTDLFSYPLYRDLRDRNRAVTGLYATGRTARLDVVIAPLDGGGTAGADPEHPRGRLVSGNFFSLLQVPAQLGRTFSADEDQAPLSDPVVVLSHGYWQRRFAGQPSVLGRRLTINGAPLTIVGVTPAGFTGDLVGQPTDIWIPLMMQPGIMPHTSWLTDRSIGWLLLMGRLAPGVTLPQARAELQRLAALSIRENANAADLPSIERDLKTRPVPVESGARGFSYYRSQYAEALVTLLSAVGVVLLVVCANVATLMLARAAGRSREMSVRMALGAGRRRLVQQLLTESVILAAAGGALGLVVALWGSTALLRLAGGGTGIPLDIRLDGRMLGITAMLSLFTAVLFGLAPALRATRIELATALRTQGRGGAGAGFRPGRPAFGKLLVMAQVALSLLLLVGTGMLLRSLGRLEHADVGLARDSLVIARVDAEGSGYAGPRLLALLRDLPAQVSRVPGVAAVSISENGIFSGTESSTTLQVEGFVARADEDTAASYDDVGPGYFRTVGAHLLSGRDFAAPDNEGGQRVAVVNETMARFYFPAGGALGRHVTVDSASFEIVGVVADIEGRDLRAEPTRRLYLPISQLRQPPGVFYLQIRTTGDPARSIEPIHRALRRADPALVVLSVDPLPALVRGSIGRDRMVARVVTFFGVLTLLLAGLGLYGVMAYATARRTGEFGLRLALGAEPGRVARMVLREALLLVGGGVAVGLPLALAATRLLKAQLFGVGLLDLPSIALAIGVLAASAVLAGWLPALRAGRVAPLEAIRVE
jgi:predicted permease